MIGAFVQGVFELAKKPVYLLPALIISLAAFLVIILSAESYMAFFYSAIMLGQVPDAGILELPFYIISSYGQEIAIICASMLISLTLTLFQLYIYALSMARKEGMVQAIRDGAAKLPEIFGLVVFAALASFIYGVLGYALFAASITFDVIGIALFLLLIAWGLFGAYAFVKLIFVPVFMALEGKKLKAALSESWKWSSQRVFSIAIFLFMLSLISGAIGAFFTIVADFTDNELLLIGLVVLEVGISNAYYNIVFIKYFMQERK